MRPAVSTIQRIHLSINLFISVIETMHFQNQKGLWQSWSQMTRIINKRVCNSKNPIRDSISNIKSFSSISRSNNNTQLNESKIESSQVIFEESPKILKTVFTELQMRKLGNSKLTLYFYPKYFIICLSHYFVLFWNFK